MFFARCGPHGYMRCCGGLADTAFLIIRNNNFHATPKLMNNRKNFLLYTTEEFAFKLDEEVMRIRKENLGQDVSHLTRNDLILKILAEYAESNGWEVSPYPNPKK